MKTSNLIFAATLALLLGSLTAYNATLRHEIAQHHYRDPLHNYTVAKLQNFNEVVVPTAGFVQVKIVAGPYGVRIHKDVAEHVRVVQQGQRLTVVVDELVKNSYNGETVVLSCPRLAQVAIEDARQPKTEDVRGFSYVEIKGFVQDSLVLRQQSGTVELAGNTLGRLRTVAAGRDEQGACRLRIGKDNSIQAADITMSGDGQLALENAIPQLRSHLSATTTVTLSGTATGSLR